MPGANGRPAQGPHGDHWSADGAGHGRPPQPPVAYDACDKQAGRVSSLSLVRYRTNDYSVPAAYGYRGVLVRGYVDAVVISCGTEIIARHPRSYERDDFFYDPIHTCRSWSGSRAPWTKQRRCRAGLCPMSSGGCAGCWSPAWDGGANGSSCRCSGCWRLSLSRRWLQRQGTPSGWEPSASMQ